MFLRTERQTISHPIDEYSNKPIFTVLYLLLLGFLIVPLQNECSVEGVVVPKVTPWSQIVVIKQERHGTVAFNGYRKTL